MIVKPFCLANSQTIISETLPRLKSCTCFEPANTFEKAETSLGERFWSKRSFIRQKVQSVPYLPHSLNKQVCLPFPNMENCLGFVQNSFLKPGSSARQQQLSAFPAHRVCRFFCRALRLFFHLISWYQILIRNYKKMRNNTLLKYTLKIIPKICQNILHKSLIF